MAHHGGRSQCFTGVLALMLVALSGAALAQQPPAPAPSTVPGQPTVPGQTPAPEKPAEPGQPTTPEPTPTAPSPGPLPALPVPVIPETQPIGPPPTVPSAPLRLLPPTVGLPATTVFQFEPFVTLREEYTDNFFLTKRDKESNFRTTVAPELRLRINAPFTKGLLSYTFSPAYDTLSEEFSFFHTLLGQVVWQANPRWQLTLADTFTKSDDRSEADRLGLREERRTFTTNTLSLSSDYLIGPVATRQYYRWFIFSDDKGGETTTHTLGANGTVPVLRVNLFSLGYEYLTSKSAGNGGGGTSILVAGEKSTVKGHQVTASASRQLTPLTLVGVKGSYGLRDVKTDDDDLDYQIWTGSVFARYVFPGRLVLDVSVGVSGLTAESQTLGPNISTASSLTYQFSRATATLAVDRGLAETFVDTADFGVVETEGVTGTFAYDLTPSIRVTITGRYRHNKFTDVAGRSVLARRDEETESWGGSAAMSWRVLRNVLLDVAYVYNQQVAFGSSGGATTGDRDSFTENRVQAAIRINF
jgi:hypothetical protein